MTTTDTQICVTLNGTITIELNGQVLVMNPNDYTNNTHRLNIRISNNTNTVPIISTNQNIIINGDTGALIRHELSKLFTLGERLFSDQENVVKVYKEESFASEKGFMREVRYLMNFDGKLIRHPNIVKIYYGSSLKINDDTFNYYKMKYYKFNSLNRYKFLSHNKFKQNEKILRFIMLQLVNAVLFIQSHNIIHRDIRPANIFIETVIDNLPIIALADFECATKINFSSRKETDIIGAKLCAPEVETEGYSFESDNFSIGLTLFELITGHCNYTNSNVEQFSKEFNLSKEFTEIIFNLLKPKTERLSLNQAIRQLFKLSSNNINWSQYINTNNEITKLVHSNPLFELGVIEQDFRNFQFISDKPKHDNDFQIEALKRNYQIYQFFKEEEKTDIMTKLAFTINYKSLQYAPNELKQDINLMNEFTEMEPLSLEYVWYSILENLPIEKIVKKNGLALRFVPITKQNLEIVKTAVLQNAKALQFASNEIKKNFLEKTLATTEMFGKIKYFFTSNNDFTTSLDIVIESMKYNSKYFKQYFLPLIRENVELDMSTIDFDFEGLKEIVKLTKLTKLDISKNNINSEGAKEISKLINLKNLNISKNIIDSEGVKEIVKLINLTELDISENYFNLEGIKEISKLINLTTLGVSYSQIGLEGVKEISKLINLKKLNISKNNINLEGVKEIVKLINLTQLDISRNDIGLEGAKEIGKLINLTELDISNNNIGLEGAIEISKLINLTRLDISYNNIGSKGVKEIVKLINLIQLNIYNNRINVEEAMDLVKLNNLTELNYKQIGVEREGDIIKYYN